MDEKKVNGYIVRLGGDESMRIHATGVTITDGGHLLFMNEDELVGAFGAGSWIGFRKEEDES